MGAPRNSASSCVSGHSACPLLGRQHARIGYFLHPLQISHHSARRRPWPRRSYRCPPRPASSPPPIRDALIACDDDDAAARELVLHANGRTSTIRASTCRSLVMIRIGSREADGIAAELADGHRQQGHGDALTGGEQHVELPTIGVRRHLPGQGEQLVGRVTHRGHDDGHIVSSRLCAHDPLRDLLDARHVGNAAASVPAGRRRAWSGDDNSREQLPASSSPSFQLSASSFSSRSPVPRFPGSPVPRFPSSPVLQFSNP